MPICIIHRRRLDVFENCIKRHHCTPTQGADVEVEDKDGNTALHLVVGHLRAGDETQAASLVTLFVNILLNPEPKNMDEAPVIKTVNRFVSTVEYQEDAFIISSTAHLRIVHMCSRCTTPCISVQQ